MKTELYDFDFIYTFWRLKCARLSRLIICLIVCIIAFSILTIKVCAYEFPKELKFTSKWRITDKIAFQDKSTLKKYYS